MPKNSFHVAPSLLEHSLHLIRTSHLLVRVQAIATNQKDQSDHPHNISKGPFDTHTASELIAFGVQKLRVPQNSINVLTIFISL